MKKLLLGLLVLLVVFLGAGGYYVYQSGMLDNLGKAVQVDAQPEPVSSSAPEQKPQMGTKKAPETYADLLQALDNERKQNPDTVGWLDIPGTPVSNSVLQAYNNTYYLRRDERKQDSVYGCYYADFACSFGKRDEMSTNTIIYGHSDLKDSLDGPRFSQLFNFTDEEFARSHPYINFSTMQEQMRWKIFAVFYTNTDFNYIETEPDEAAFKEMIERAKLESLYVYDESPVPGDKILTLSTCSVKYGKDGNQRFVVMAKLMPPEYEGDMAAGLEKNLKTPHP